MSHCGTMLQMPKMDLIRVREYQKSTHFVRGRIPIRLTSNFFDSAALIMLSQPLVHLFGQIQTCQTGSQPFSGTYAYVIGECSLEITMISPFCRRC